MTARVAQVAGPGQVQGTTEMLSGHLRGRSGEPVEKELGKVADPREAALKG